MFPAKEHADRRMMSLVVMEDMMSFDYLVMILGERGDAGVQ